MRFKGGVWKPVVAELRKRLIFESCLDCNERPSRCICIHKTINDIERMFKYYVQWFGFEKMEFLRMRQKFVDLRRRSLEQYYKDQDTIKELREQMKERE